MTHLQGSARVRAWAKPLKHGYQYYARVEGHERIMGSAWHAEEAHDIIVDYVAKHAGHENWDIEWKAGACRP